MMRNDSNWINDLFATDTHDWTPSSAHHAACVLYAPVSGDPEVSARFASVLSDAELHRADRFVTEGGKANFIQRRAFRRYCGAVALGAPQPLSQIVFKETEKGRPYLPDLPDFWFSFSSCRLGFLGAWSSTHAIGVDIEDQTNKLEVTELAQQFFSQAEAKAVDRADGLTRMRTFYQLWTVKEAALKSIGEGLPFGLDAFELELTPNLRIVYAPHEHGGPERFKAHLIERADSCAALVIRQDIPGPESNLKAAVAKRPLGKEKHREKKVLFHAPFAGIKFR